MASNAKRGRQGGSACQRSGSKGRGSTPLPLLSSQPPLQETQLGSEDDSTQPPDAWLEQGGYRSLEDHEENDQCEATSEAAIKRRGKAKGTEFAKLRKLGRVQVSVPTGARGPSSRNALMLAARVTYIVRTFADMKYKCWSSVPTEDKEELYARVLGDFSLDWNRFEDRECIKSKLACSYKTYRYDMHNLFKKYPTKELALANPPLEMRIETWKAICEQWTEERYKKICQTNTINRKKHKIPHTAGSKSLQNLRAEKTESNENLIAFYKRSHCRKLDGKFINEMAEETYDEMVKLFAERDPSKANLEVAEQVFHDVLGHKSGHVRGLGNSAIPKPSSTSKSSHVNHLTEQVEQYKTEMVAYKEKYEELLAHMKEVMERVGSFDDKVDRLLMSSQMWTHGDQSLPQGLDPTSI